MTSVKKDKGKGKVRDKQASPESDPEFRVAKVIILPNGVYVPDSDEEEELSEPAPKHHSRSRKEETLRQLTYRMPLEKFPSNLQVQILQSQGLAVIDLEHGILFRKDEDYSEVEKRLQKLFGRLWTHFNAHQELAGDETTNVFVSDFLVCCRDWSDIYVLPHVKYPDGQHLYINSKGRRAGFLEHALVLSMWCSS
ncbi:hypothetical protein HGRIS_010485 [Hohenbuehelia grisea]|uniref:Uncharacterized protein n=1 Tax=Hohenbuehelia grisea TaxID=104357 RepID=A0ABR3IZE8_9AGAR